jgi:anaerobic dimethyl sulfoxide reductase subunit B (iron-sulfur subunit)
MRVYQWENGFFPNISLRVLPIMCFHCENPICAKACPHKAIYKEEKYGAVLLDRDKCKGERKCFTACPYGVPQFAGDEPGIEMSKCDMCVDRLEQGLKPICVLSCSLRALEFGPIDELRQKYGNFRQPEGTPRNYVPYLTWGVTIPSVVFKSVDPKRQIVPWDATKALELWQKRHSDNGEALPDVFKEIADVTRDHSDITARNRLTLKAKNTEELMFYTTDDE